MTETPRFVGYACRYTPLPLIHAAGFTPYRVLPMTEAEDQAGALLHDNMCAHVKRILDRAMAGDLPALAGMVIVNSCDAMRRLAGAWRLLRPDDRLAVIELPPGGEAGDVAYLAGEIERLRDELAAWSGRPVDDAAIHASAKVYRRLVERLESAATSLDRVRVQELTNRAVTRPPDEVLAELDRLDPRPPPAAPAGSAVPVLLIGNVLPEPAALALIETCGARIVADDLCTGAWQLAAFALAGDGVAAGMACALLTSPPCARSLVAGAPGRLAELVVERARECGARAVIAHVLKFCDPYLVRMPALNEALRAEGLPLLLLEGDCTLRAIGQQRTRIEAFVEMLEAQP
ncbi:MAG: 2-hydroxyacyl-CoA dehydratase family protein [Acidobacteriota bacterium]